MLLVDFLEHLDVFLLLLFGQLLRGVFEFAQFKEVLFLLIDHLNNHIRLVLINLLLQFRLINNTGL